MTIKQVPTVDLKDMLKSDEALYRDVRTESVKDDLAGRIKVMRVELGRRLFEGSTV